MTELLERAFAEAARRPEAEQELLASRLLAELAAEEDRLVVLVRPVHGGHRIRQAPGEIQGGRRAAVQAGSALGPGGSSLEIPSVAVTACSPKRSPSGISGMYSTSQNAS